MTEVYTRREWALCLIVFRVLLDPHFRVSHMAEEMSSRALMKGYSLVLTGGCRRSRRRFLRRHRLRRLRIGSAGSEGGKGRRRGDAAWRGLG